jgi:methyl-accepting chemotaxis protein
MSLKSFNEIVKGKAMEYSKIFSLKTKMGLTTGIIVFLTVAILTSIFIINSSKSALKSTKNETSLIAQKTALAISGKIDETLLKMQTHADYSIMMKKIPGDNRNTLTQFFKNEMDQNLLLHGVTLTFKPEIFDGLDALYAGKPGYYQDGRLNIYWYREDGEVIYYSDVVDFDKELAEAGGDWWILPERNGQTYMAVTLYTVGGKDVLILSLSIPVKENNQFAGVVCFDYQGDFMQQEALSIKEKLFGGQAEVIILTDNATIAACSANDTLVNFPARDVLPETSKIIDEEMKKEYEGFFARNDTFYLTTPIHFSRYNKPWQISIAIPKQVVMAEVNSAIAYQVLVGAIIIAISILLVILFLGRMIKPLLDLKEATKTIAEGNLQIELVEARRDEIGSLANAFHIMVTKLRDIVMGIRSGSTQILLGSQQIAHSAQSISEGSNKQASATEQVAASIEEVISAINQNSENAQNAQAIAKRAESGIEKSQQASLDTIAAMKMIAEKTSVITEIAQKTNILAINAAIEAARAGAMGKGFGIVAAEVRSLAESSHLAAEEIVKLSEQTLKMSEESGKILSEIVPDVQHTSALIQEIATASMEQNSGVNQISKAIEQLNSITLQNSATAEELASGSEELVAQAETLQKAVEFFTVENKTTVSIPEFDQKNYSTDFAEEKTEIVLPQDMEEELFKPQIKDKTTIIRKMDQKGFNLDLDNKLDDEFEKF